MFKRIACAGLSALIFAGILAACGEQAETSSPASSTTAADVITEPEETLSDIEMRQLVDDGLPESDFGGYQYRIVVESDQEWYYYVEELTGDVIDDAVYNRNTSVEERLNIKVVEGRVGDYGSNGTWMQKAVLAGEDAYDLACSHVVNISTLVLKGIFQNWYDVPYVDFEKPWWARSNIEDLTYHGVAILAIGDFALSAIGRTYCMFFNRQQAESYNITNVYETVQDGVWTIDKLSSWTQDIYTDLNANDKRDADDFYGFATGVASNIGAYLWAFDNPVCRKNADGDIEFVIHTEKMNSICETLYKIMWENTGTYYNKNHVSTVDSSGAHVGGRDLFMVGRAVFANGYLDQAIDFFREMEDDYGIIPYPKWDESQKDYRSLVDGNHAALAIPMTTMDMERAGIIIEALNAETYKSVVPLYIETALKVKYARDNESVQVIDDLLANRFFDFGYVYDGWKGASFWLEGLIQNKKTDFESHYAKNGEKVAKHYAEVLEIFDGYADN